MARTENDAKPQMTRLLSNETLARVERMRLRPNRRLTNRARGEHAAGVGGVVDLLFDDDDHIGFEPFEIIENR